MGRKIKSILMLIVLLVLIYYQHSPVIHAEDSEILNKESGEEEEEKNKNENDGDEKDEEPVKEYHLEITADDSNNGYYLTVPRVRIEHVSRIGTTVYSLKNKETVMAEGRLSDEGSYVILGDGQFAEGLHVLSVYMEDEEGERLEEYDQVREFMIDTKPPTFEMSISAGFDTWYQNETYLYVSAGDGENGSGVDTISCYCGSELIDEVKGSEGTFLINCASQNGSGVEITVFVSDRAGHQSGDIKRVYIDDCAPEIVIGGITDYMITSREVPAFCEISEENDLKYCRLTVEWEDTNGRKIMLAEPEWTNVGGRMKAEIMLTEDGIYRIKASAEDLAGYSEIKEAQVIIDSHNPVIRYVDELEGRYMKKFQWNYQKETFIQDFTTYTYQIQLDGKLYTIGEEEKDEGKHLLSVKAVDAAGNRAEAKAGFVVDHTPPEILFLDVEDSEIYEEEKSFRIITEDSKDKIQEVRINGVLQDISQGEREYSFTVCEKKDYEITVKACDKAGNESISSMLFTVIPKETMIQKTLKPIRQMFMKEELTEKVNGKIKKESTESHKIPVVPVSAAVCSVCAAVGIWCKKKLL